MILRHFPMHGLSSVKAYAFLVDLGAIPASSQSQCCHAIRPSAAKLGKFPGVSCQASPSIKVS